MAKKLPPYEADIRRTEKLAVQTAKALKVSRFKEDVFYITKALRTHRNTLTPLALHLIGLAGKELCEKRGSMTKILLVSALSISEQNLSCHLTCSVYPMAFHEARKDGKGNPVPPPVESILQSIQQGNAIEFPPELKNVLSQMLNGHMPEGCTVVKFPISQPQTKAPKPPGLGGGNSRLN